MKLLHFSIFLTLLPILFLPCTAQVQFFINCGSSDNATTTNGQTFVGDEKSDTVHHSGRDSKIVTDSNQSEALYQTARVCHKPSSYDFDISQTGTYFVRLHFCAFSSVLADAKFSVSASGHVLLTDFSPAGKTDSNCSRNSSEFILNISDVKEKFRIYFVPTSSSSVAFVNAIEVFSTLLNITEDTGPLVAPAGRLGDYKGQKSKVLETIYRINVGGKEVEASSSNLWRTWMIDDPYLINKVEAENAPDNTGSVRAVVDAPPAVYGTAKIPKKSLVTNLTWKFKVNKGNLYFVRVHFCDIISLAAVPYSFNFYIYSNFKKVIDQSQIKETDEPFHQDYLVDSDDFGYLNISVGPNNSSNSMFYAFLNGLEIMQVKDETVGEPRIEGSPSHLVLVAGLFASAVAILIVAAATAVFLRQRKKRKESNGVSELEAFSMYGALSSHNRNSHGTSSQASTFQSLQLGLKIPFVEIRRITNNFDENLIIGEGGFGKVYRGTLRSGLKVAVKRGSPDHGQGMLEFQTEITILSTIRHRHLVSLIGYCYEDGEMILVYEFMEKGTLRCHLYESEHNSVSSAKGMLSWKQRLEICIGAAKGIQYLHTGTNKGIIHRDVKSTNILLDENYVAKVADFGLSRSGYLEESHVSISDVKGTLGYLDPEYISCLQLTEKSDVYAFGVVLFEVLCARPVIDLSLPREQISLPDWAVACFEEGQIEKIIDPVIAGEIDPNSLKKFCETAETCLKKDASERAPMSDVCWSLEYALQLQKAAAGALLDDTVTDVSLNMTLPAENMTLPAVQRFNSQNIDDYTYDVELTDNGTGEVFSQLTSNDGSGR